jgi:ABC-type hemin transport system ATPase subunit
MAILLKNVRNKTILLLTVLNTLRIDYNHLIIVNKVHCQFSRGYVCAVCVAHNLNLANTRSDDQIRDTRRSWNVMPKSRIKITNIIASSMFTISD